MFLHIDPSGGLAVYDQIVRQMKYAVANGALPERELVPSVRELARELAINPNTVARAYGRLQDAQLLEPIRGRGLAVVGGARKKCQADRTRLIGARLFETLAEARQSGLERLRIESLVQQALDELDQQSNQGTTSQSE